MRNDEELWQEAGESSQHRGRESIVLPSLCQLLLYQFSEVVLQDCWGTPLLHWDFGGGVCVGRLISTGFGILLSLHTWCVSEVGWKEVERWQ